jgi:capsular polysaccharide transport system permease protein
MKEGEHALALCAGATQVELVVGTLRRLAHKAGANWLLWVAAVLPSCASIAYFGFIASPVYVSESRVVVRSPQQQTASPLGTLLKGAGFARAQDDAYAIQDFLLSRDALKALDSELGIKAAYSADSVDWLSRFGGTPWGEHFEDLYLYYLKKVSVQLDPNSSIASLSIRAFSADTAHAMNRRLLELSEDLVNRLNERGRQDMIRFAVAEVHDAQKKASTAALALAGYRNRQGVIDPERQSALPLQRIARLQDELAESNSQVALLEKLASDNPQLPVFRQRAQLLQSEIRGETARVAGSGSRSLADKAAEFQRLSLEKEFSDKMLASAMSTLEQARNDAHRKQLYLERIVQPSRPDAPMEPRRIRSILVTLVVSLLVWGIASLLAAGIREHHE